VSTYGEQQREPWQREPLVRERKQQAAIGQPKRRSGWQGARARRASWVERATASNSSRNSSSSSSSSATAAPLSGLARVALCAHAPFFLPVSTWTERLQMRMMVSVSSYPTSHVCSAFDLE
jgi:hypothetical protein